MTFKTMKDNLGQSWTRLKQDSRESHTLKLLLKWILECAIQIPVWEWKTYSSSHFQGTLLTISSQFSCLLRNCPGRAGPPWPRVPLLPRTALIQWLISKGVNRPEPSLYQVISLKSHLSFKALPGFGWSFCWTSFGHFHLLFCSILLSSQRCWFSKYVLVNPLHAHFHLRVYFLTGQPAPFSWTLASFHLSLCSSAHLSPQQSSKYYL